MEQPGFALIQPCESQPVRRSQPTGSPRSSTTMQRSASPSKHTPKSAFSVRTPSRVDARLASTSGFGSCTNSPVELSKLIAVIFRPFTSPKTFGTIVPAMPLDASITTCSVRVPSRISLGRNCRMCARYPSQRSRVSSLPPPGPMPVRAPSAIALMALSPVSWPTGFAPAALTLKPLYCAGLWLAVVCTAPAAFSAFTA